MEIQRGDGAQLCYNPELPPREKGLGLNSWSSGVMQDSWNLKDVIKGHVGIKRHRLK